MLRMHLKTGVKNRGNFEYIAGWIDSERSHALWCANSFSCPVTAGRFMIFEKNRGAVERQRFCGDR